MADLSSCSLREARHWAIADLDEPCQVGAGSWEDSEAGLAERVGVGRERVVRLEQGHPRLEAQLVLDALDASGVRLMAASADETDGADSEMERSSALDSPLDSHVDRDDR